MTIDSGELANSMTPSGRYGRGAIWFHWATALLVVWVGVLGLLHDSWPRRTQSFWINVHALSGLLVWGVVLARFWWRNRHPGPSLPPGVGEFSRRVSKPVHLLLYTLLLIIPILGIVTFIWHGRVFDFGLFRINPGIRSNRAIFHPTEDIHGYLAYALFVLAGMHAGAALYHHLIRRDDVLRRMWPRPSGNQKTR
jgi:cytochrome b561